MKNIKAKELIVKSKLPGTDYVLNPYVGCTNSCTYCYATFMRRFYKIEQEWGTFVFKKDAPMPSNLDKYSGKRILLSSVTDPYQNIEKKEEHTRDIIKSFISSSVKLEILTKSDLVLRDIDYLQQIPQARVGLSMGLKNDSDIKLFEKNCISYNRRLEALKSLSTNNIENYVFISPIFPFLTDYKQIIKDTYNHVDFIYVENLNLRGLYKTEVLEKIEKSYPDYYKEYLKIYSDKAYAFIFWENIKTDIINTSKQLGCLDKLSVFFYHDIIKKNKNVT